MYEYNDTGDRGGSQQVLDKELVSYAKPSYDDTSNANTNIVRSEIKNKIFDDTAMAESEVKDQLFDDIDEAKNKFDNSGILKGVDEGLKATDLSFPSRMYSKDVINLGGSGGWASF